MNGKTFTSVMLCSDVQEERVAAIFKFVDYAKQETK
jgi:hypothetical protein